MGGRSRLAIVNSHTDRTRIFYRTCEIKQINDSRDLNQKLVNIN